MHIHGRHGVVALLAVGFAGGLGCGGGGTSGARSADVDSTPPAASITAPAGGSSLSGTVSVVATVTDDIGVAEVALRIDGSDTGRTFVESPAHVFTSTVDTTSLGDGGHTLQVCALDTSANGSCSSVVSVNVSNVGSEDTTPPTATITSPLNGSAVSGKTAVTASISDASGVGVVVLLVNGNNTGGMNLIAPGVYSQYANTMFTCNGDVTFQACAYDASSNHNYGCSATVTATIANCPDSSPPVVAITSPADGATISGLTTVTASITDNLSVFEEWLLVDGVNVADYYVFEFPHGVFNVSIDTAGHPLADGVHTLQLCARDFALNSACSQTLSITVAH